MYKVQSSESGYTFTTNNQTQYVVYFTKLDKFSEYFIKEIDTDEIYYFGIERISAKVGGKDYLIKRTIASIIIHFFVENPTSVLLFNYSNDTSSISSRRKVFKQWFDEYAEHTLYQFYQHDYSDEVTLCALYRRQGKNFDKIRTGIMRITTNIGSEFQLGK